MMPAPIPATKLFIPPPRPKAVLRPRLTGRLNEGVDRKLTLLSAPAGFGKTTLLAEWVAGCGRPAAWLSLDEEDGDPARFLTCLVAALQTLHAELGKSLLGALQSPQPPPVESVLAALINELAAVPDAIVLVLDDYHVVDSEPADRALGFLLEHLPPRMHLVVATREDPDLPLAKLRARGQLTELRAADLRFTPAEAADFLNRVMGLSLAEADIAALEARTEGWIAGLQLAAISMQGSPDAAGFIHSFTGSHRFVLDFLVDEVLMGQTESLQTFLLRTSILDRLCGPLCDAVARNPSASGQKTLEYLERANLFLVPLDNERNWFRYHHLFADLLRQRLIQGTTAPSSARGEGTDGGIVAELHGRASQWYEDNGLELEAFHHAAAANDIERAERLIQGKGMPLYFRGAMAPVIRWMESLPAAVLDAKPSLWVAFALALMLSGRPGAVEQKLQAAEAALKGVARDETIRDLDGQIAATRALVAASQSRVDTVLAQSQRAMELLRPENLPVRMVTTLTQGIAYQLQGERAAAARAYAQAVSAGRASGNTMVAVAAASSLGQIQEAENQLLPAAETYRSILDLVGDPGHMGAGEALGGLGRIFYEWNDLDSAERYGRQSLTLVRQVECDLLVIREVFLARIQLARRDYDGASAMLAAAGEEARAHAFLNQVPEISAVQVLVLLRQGDLAAAARLAQSQDIPASRARVHLAQGDPSAALAVLEPCRRQTEAGGSPAERLKVMVLQALALHARGDTDQALEVLGEALALAEPGGFIRMFIDEGAPMARLISEASAQGIRPDYTRKLLDAFQAEGRSAPIGQQDASTRVEGKPAPAGVQPMIEPLSERELEVLRLIARGLSNREIGERLSLALSTVKGHNLKIFGKLQARSRTEAVARARELGLI